MANRYARGTDLSINFWPSYTDISMLMILILIIYLFTQVVSSAEAFKLAKIRQKQQQITVQIESTVKGALGDEGMKKIGFSNDFKAQHITFSDQVLFESGSADLKAEGMGILKLIGEVLKKNIGLYYNIQIEGHTDRVPLRGGKFRSNWDLSSSRATEVVKYFESIGLNPAQVQMSAAGFAEYRPVDTGDSPEAYAKNRRIEMIINYQPD